MGLNDSDDEILSEWGQYYFCRPRLFEPKGSCPDELWREIWKNLPKLKQHLEVSLIFTPFDGCLIKDLLNECERTDNARASMIFFVHTEEGHIIGGYSPIMFQDMFELSVRGGMDFANVGEAFAFRMLQGQTPEIFPWSG